MRYVVSGLGVIAALLLMVAAGWMNWRFMTSLASDEADRLALGGASIGIDVMKAALAYLVALAWDRRQWGYVGAGGITSALLAAISLASSFGFAAESRDAVLSGRQLLAARHKAAAIELGETEGKLNAYGVVRASGIIGTEISGMEKESQWRTTKGCTLARKAEDAAFCKNYGRHVVELETARTFEVLEARRGQLRALLTELGEKGALRAADRQTMYAAWLGITESGLRNSLLLLLSAVLELGAGLGVYLALRPVAGKGREELRPDEQTKVPLVRVQVSPAAGADLGERSAGDLAVPAVPNGQDRSHQVKRRRRSNEKSATSSKS